MAEQTGSAPSGFSFALVDLPISSHPTRGVTEQCVRILRPDHWVFSAETHTHSGEDTWFFGGCVCQRWDLRFLHLELVVTNGAFPTGLRPIKRGSRWWKLF